MFAAPTAREIAEAAASMGLEIDADQLPDFQRAITAQLQHFYEFLQARGEEDVPPQLFPERARGHRPRRDEDIYRAWLWKCDVGGRANGLLSGKTVSFKDHVSVAGIPQSFTSLALDSFVPEIDATVVTRVLAAGARVIGKNMMNGFTADYGLPTNPHNTAYSAGGSSSGSAAALAAREVDVSFGGDQGGSIRIPAAYCGVVGLKPTFGLISHFGVGFGSEQSVDHVGPMARRVEDVAAALQAVAGFDPNDPRQGRDIPLKYDATSRLDSGVAGLRIGILDEGFDDPLNPEVGARVLEAIDVLMSAGATVTKISVPAHRELDDVYAALTLEGARSILDGSFYGMGSKGYYPVATITAIDRLWREHSDMFPPNAKINHLVAGLSRKRYHGAVYAKAHNARPTFVRAYDSALYEVDVLAMPTVREIAPQAAGAASTDPVAPGESSPWRNWIYMPYVYNTKPSNYTGHPALTVPCGKVDGMPVGLQLMGRFLDDNLLLRVAYAYQSSVDWDALNGVSI